MWFQSLLSALCINSQHQRSLGHSGSGAYGRRKRLTGDYRHHPRRLFLEGLEDRRVFALDAPVLYAAGSDSRAIIAADFNNDSIVDLASVSSANSSISILLGNSNDTFQPASFTPTGVNPSSLAVGDLDGDGNLDLATANVSDVSILRGNGDGTFDLSSSLSVPSEPSSVAMGDFNGDGKLDLGVTSNYSYGGPYYYGAQGIASVLIGNGQGGFSGLQTTSLGTGFYTAATAANLDGIGADELVVANSLFGFATGAIVLRADASETLFVANSLYTGMDATDVAVDDVNSDGFADVVTANGNYGGVSVLLGDGLGGYGTARTFAAGSYPYSLALGDITGDGNVDIVAVDYYAGVNVLYGAGDGAFSLPLPSPAGSFPYSLASGDFNHDGWLDVAVSGLGSGTISVLLNNRNWPTPTPSLSIDNVVVTEGDSGTVAAIFTVTRSGSLAGSTAVNYCTSSGGALPGSDYVSVSNGAMIFNPGEATKTITILVNGDRIDENDQGFFVNLTGATGAVIVDGQGFGNILDDDEAPTMSITSKVSGKEGANNKTTAFVFYVTLSGLSEKEVRVDFATANGTATTAGNDYVATSDTLVFAPGVISKPISVSVRGDKDKELNETFFVNLSSARNATIGLAQGIGEILDDDSSPGQKKQKAKR